MNRTLIGTALAAGSALALVAGCGGNSPTPTAATSGTGSTASAGASPAGASASVGAMAPAAALQAALSDSSGDKSVSFTGSFSSAKDSGHIAGQEQFAPQFAMSINVTSPQSTADEILIGDTVYFKDPALAGALGGKSWFSFDLAQTGSAGSAFAAETASLKSSNPADLIESMLVSDNLADLGPQTVDGVQTTHYSGTVDPSTAYDGALAEKYLTPAEIKQLRSVQSAGGSTSQKIDLWLAADGLPVQIVIVDSGTAGTTTSTTQFSDWGQPVHISAPPAGEVGAFPGLTSGAPST